MNSIPFKRVIYISPKWRYSSPYDLVWENCYYDGNINKNYSVYNDDFSLFNNANTNAGGSGLVLRRLRGFNDQTYICLKCMSIEEYVTDNYGRLFQDRDH
jgi:hypothetical protein